MRKWLIVIGLIAVGAGLYGWKVYQGIFSSNTSFDNESTVFYVPTGQSMDGLVSDLVDLNIIQDVESFKQTASLKKFEEKVQPGRYRISKGMNNNQLVNMLRSGSQEPVNATFSDVRSLEIVAGRLSANLEVDSADLASYIMSPDLPSRYGFNDITFSSMFIPNTYEVWWNTSSEALVQRLADEYKKFWNEDRLSKCTEMNLSQSEVTTLASIVKAETSIKLEAPRVAGVYLNRLKRGMLLQADPTLVFAHGDFTITRVLDKHKEIDSPYNTYKYGGLPPGPINIPSPAYIDAVLNAEDHDYFYFCAKADFSGEHHFSKTYQQHLQYASKYRRELNKRRIYK